LTPLLWGGRFATPPDDGLLAFASSYADDRVLAPFDVAATKAHVLVLERAAIVDAVDRELIHDALATMSEEIGAQTFALGGRHEDIHSALETRVEELAGAAAGKMQAGRSRNDQVATALALYLRDALGDIARSTCRLADDLLVRAQAELGEGTLVIGTTHGQPAQPILLAFWLHAAAVGVVRQMRRVAATRANIDRCPLGAGPIAGSSLPLDREYAAKLLGFSAGPTENALDTVGDRDAALESLFACAALMTHLSRICAEIVAWCAPTVGLAALDDAVATGSSALPQKKNPDVFELVRAKAASVVGLLGAALAHLKGLPLSYHRDLQETKRAAIAGVEETRASIVAFRATLRGLRFDRQRCNRSADDSFACATDLAEQLVGEGVPLRDAHRRVGERVRAAESAGTALCGGDGRPLDPRTSVLGKKTAGSTNPDMLAAAIERTRKRASEIVGDLG